jgi:hypothetical protein
MSKLSELTPSKKGRTPAKDSLWLEALQAIDRGVSVRVVARALAEETGGKSIACEQRLHETYRGWRLAKSVFVGDKP